MNFKEFTNEYIEAVMKGFGRKVEMTCFVDPLKPHALICKKRAASYETKSISLDIFINSIAKHIQKNLSIPEAVLKMKYVKDPTLSEAILTRLKDQAKQRYLHRLKITDMVFNKFLSVYIRRTHSQFRHMWE